MGDEEDTIRNLFKSGSLVFAGFVVENGVAFLAKLFVVRNLEKFEFGIVALGIAFLSTTTAIATFGVNKGIGRYLPRYDDAARIRGIVRSGFEVVVPAAVAIAAVAIILAGPVGTQLFEEEVAVTVFRIFALALPFAVTTKLALGGIMGAQRTTPKILIQNLIMPAVRFGSVGLAILFGAQAVGFSIAYTLPHVAGATVGLYFLFQHGLFGRGEYVPMRLSLLRFSLPLALGSILGSVLADADKFLLGYFAGPNPVADYDVVYTLANVLMIFLMSFGYLFLPKISELHSKGDIKRMRRLYRTVTKWMGLTMLPFLFGLLMFPELTISVTFGGRFVSAGMALRILAVAFGLRVLIGPNTNALTAFGHADFLLYTTALAAVLNVGLNILLIPPYGIEGAAVATFASYTAVNAIKSIKLYNEYGINPITGAFFRPLLASTGLALLIYLLVVPLIDLTVLSVVILFIVLVAVYPVVIVAFGGVEREELIIVESVEDRFGIDLDPIKKVFEILI